MSDPRPILYEEAYDPMTQEWFERFEASPLVEATAQEAVGQDLMTTVLAFNDVFHRIVDEQIDDRSDVTVHALEVVGEHHERVFWAGQCVPPENPSAKDIERSFRHKFARNISLAYQEGLVVVGSAANALQERLIAVQSMPEILGRSYRLVGGLAVLNDQHEVTRLKELLETEDEISYPQTTFEDILSGKIQIHPDKFMTVDGEDSLSLAFRGTPDLSEVLSRPTMRCPAHRIKVGGTRLNETFWDLLIDIQLRSA
jgi:hypothetical protein